MNLPPGHTPIEANVPLAPRTTIGVGGRARWFVTIAEEKALCEALGWSDERGLAVFVLGGGSNVVVSDQGFDGLVIDVALRGTRCTEIGGGVQLRVGAGESWDEVVDYAVTRGLAGIECLSGIPGRVGATPIQNVGAYGQEVSETIVEVEAISRTSGKRTVFSNEQCGFGYRDSVFKHEEKDAWIVTAVTFALDRDRPPAIRYQELEKKLSATPTLRDVRQAVLALRRGKGMVIDPGDPDSRSVGSFFMNPIIDDPAFDELVSRAEALGHSRDAIPAFEAGDGRTKVSAAWLIERAGFEKGYIRGTAGLSRKHSLALVNRGGATASAVRELALEIQGCVLEKFGVKLEPEARFVGWPKDQ